LPKFAPGSDPRAWWDICAIPWLALAPAPVATNAGQIALTARLHDRGGLHLGWRTHSPDLHSLAPDLRLERTRQQIMGPGAIIFCWNAPKAIAGVLGFGTYGHDACLGVVTIGNSLPCVCCVR